MSHITEPDLKQIRVLIPTSRDVYRLVSYGMVIDFEDAVASASDTDFVSVPLHSRRAQVQGSGIRLGEAMILTAGGIVVVVEAVGRLVDGGQPFDAHWYVFAVIGVALTGSPLGVTVREGPFVARRTPVSRGGRFGWSAMAPGVGGFELSVIDADFRQPRFHMRGDRDPLAERALEELDQARDEAREVQRSPKLGRGSSR